MSTQQHLTTSCQPGCWRSLALDSRCGHHCQQPILSKTPSTNRKPPSNRDRSWAYTTSSGRLQGSPLMVAPLNTADMFGAENVTHNATVCANTSCVSHTIRCLPETRQKAVHWNQATCFERQIHWHIGNNQALRDTSFQQQPSPTQVHTTNHTTACSNCQQYWKQTWTAMIIHH